MHVLIAPERFGARTGAQATATALAAGWSRGAPHDSVEVSPLSDGGRGFVDLVSSALDTQAGPDGVLLVPGTRGRTTAYIDASRSIESRRWAHGLADRIERAVDEGASRVVVGLPGPHELITAPDAGAGLLAALGALTPGTRLEDVTTADLRGLPHLRERLGGTDLVGATASDVPLLGLHGASAGAVDAGALGAQAADDLERAIGHFAHVVRQVLAAAPQARSSLPLAGAIESSPVAQARELTRGAGTGAGGGLGFALRALGGRLVAGADVFAALARTTERAEHADLLVTARGSLDSGALHGSALAAALRAAATWGVPCLAVAGTSMMSRREQAAAGLNALVTLPVRTPADDAGPGSVEQELERCADRLARTWSPSRVLGHT